MVPLKLLPLMFVAAIMIGTAVAESTKSVDVQVARVRAYKTNHRGEIPSVLPLPTRVRTAQGSGLQEHYQVVFSLPVGRLSEGDLLSVSAEFEATNDCGYDIALGTWLMIGKDPSRTVPDARRGESYLSYPAGFNIINGNYLLPGAGDRSFMHHGFVSRSSTFVVPKGMNGTWHINFIAYAQTDKLDCKKGGGLTVEKGNGQLNVMHFINK